MNELKERQMGWLHQRVGNRNRESKIMMTHALKHPEVGIILINRFYIRYKASVIGEILAGRAFGSCYYGVI